MSAETRLLVWVTTNKPEVMAGRGSNEVVHHREVEHKYSA